MENSGEKSCEEWLVNSDSDEFSEVSMSRDLYFTTERHRKG